MSAFDSSFAGLRTTGSRVCMLLALLLPGTQSLWSAAPKQPRATDPVVTIPMEPLGFLGAPARLFAIGSTLYTLHFVDETHLLLTFNSRGLMGRLPDATPDDDDRLVAALLLELPSGKVLARTTWRTRDRDQYLWSLGHGSFLLRIRERLSIIQPLANLGQENPFREQPFLEMKRRIAYVTVSPGGDLLTVETAPPRRSEPTGPASNVAQTPAAAAQNPPPPQSSGPAPNAGQGAPATPGVPQLRKRTQPPGSTAAPNGNSADAQNGGVQLNEPEPPGRPPVELHFYRLTMEQEQGKPPRMLARTAGLLASRALVNLPVTAEGFLDMLKEKGQTYDFDFETHTGKRTQLAAFDTTCAPRPYFVSRSEFVAFGCHGSSEKVEISGFNLRGEEPWISVLSGQHVSPAIISAPQASRFALSRVLVSSGSLVDPETVPPDELTTQEIAVIQHHDGRSLLKLQVTPIQRSGQNFDLSADGMSLAVVRNGNVEVYRLPALTAADRKALELAAAAQPERNEASVRLITEKRVAGVAPAEAVTVPTVRAEAAPSSAPPAPAATLGDVHPTDTPRKAPSLYDADHPKGPNDH